MTSSPSSVPGRARSARPGRRALLLATSAALLGGMLVPFTGAGSAGAAPAPRPEAPRSDVTTESHTVTLVTGD
ncbi:hypothetical protein G3M53_44960, partial [Streptomyces sp. SID7982]|nr:hypothetical protein [Streptomyces sp. SID7982]